MRRLSLKKDTLTELDTDELSSVVGGITTLQWPSVHACEVDAPTLPVLYCVTGL